MCPSHGQKCKSEGEVPPPGDQSDVHPAVPLSRVSVLVTVQGHKSDFSHLTAMGGSPQNHGCRPTHNPQLAWWISRLKLLMKPEQLHIHTASTRSLRHSLSPRVSLTLQSQHGISPWGMLSSLFCSVRLAFCRLPSSEAVQGPPVSAGCDWRTLFCPLHQFWLRFWS